MKKYFVTLANGEQVKIKAENGKALHAMLDNSGISGYMVRMCTDTYIQQMYAAKMVVVNVCKNAAGTKSRGKPIAKAGEQEQEQAKDQYKASGALDYSTVLSKASTEYGLTANQLAQKMLEYAFAIRITCNEQDRKTWNYACNELIAPLMQEALLHLANGDYKGAYKDTNKYLYGEKKITEKEGAKRYITVGENEYCLLDLYIAHSVNNAGNIKKRDMIISEIGKNLSDRQKDIFRLMLLDYSTRQIMYEMGFKSPAPVQEHAKKIRIIAYDTMKKNGWKLEKYSKFIDKLRDEIEQEKKRQAAKQAASRKK